MQDSMPAYRTRRRLAVSSHAWEYGTACAPERADVARPPEVAGRGGRVGHQAQSERPVLRGDARRYALARVHRHLRRTKALCLAWHAS